MMKWTLAVEIEAGNLEEMITQVRERFATGISITLAAKAGETKEAGAVDHGPRKTLPEAAWSVAQAFTGWFKSSHWRAELARQYPYHREKIYGNGLNQAAAYMLKKGKLERQGSRTEAEWRVIPAELHAAVAEERARPVWPAAQKAKEMEAAGRPAKRKAKYPQVTGHAAPVPAPVKAKAPEPNYTPLKGDSQFKDLMRQALKNMVPGEPFTRDHLAACMKALNADVVTKAPAGSLGAALADLRQDEGLLELVERNSKQPGLTTYQV